MWRRSRLALATIAVLTWVSATACQCGGALGGLVGARTPTAQPVATAPLPTLGAPTVAAVPGAGLQLPPGSDQPFVIEMTESDLNGYLADMAVTQEGLTVSEPRAIFGQGQVSASFLVDHAESGVSGEITVFGAPQVVQGQVFIKVTGYELGPSFTGFTRLVALALIKDALKQYETGDGIPVPVEGMLVERVEVTPGKMTVWGRTR